MNPYESPRAVLSANDRPQHLAAPRAQARRPLSVWLLLVLAGGLGIFFGVGVFKHLFEAVIGSGSGSPLESAADAGILVAVTGYLIALALAIQRRIGWMARTQGTLLLVLFVFGVGHKPPSAQCTASPGCAPGWWAAQLLVDAMLIGWAFAAGWSPAAKRYYLARQAAGDDKGESDPSSPGKP